MSKKQLKTLTEDEFYALSHDNFFYGDDYYDCKEDLIENIKAWDVEADDKNLTYIERVITFAKPCYPLARIGLEDFLEGIIDNVGERCGVFSVFVDENNMSYIEWAQSYHKETYEGLKTSLDKFLDSVSKQEFYEPSKEEFLLRIKLD